MFYEPDTQLNGIILMSSSLRGAETSGFYLRDNAACINTHLHILPRHTHTQTEWGGRWCIIKMEADERSACRSTPPCIYRRVPQRPQKIETCLWIHTHFTVIMSEHWGVRVLVCVCVCRRLLLHAVHQAWACSQSGYESTVLLQPHVGPTCTCADPGVSEMLTKMCAED